MNNINILLKQSSNRGITIIALIITIVLMLILSTVAIDIAADGNLFDYAGQGRLREELADLQSRFTKEQLKSDNKIKNGTINEILKIESPYNNKLAIEDGKIVYLIGWTDEEIEILEEMGIKKGIAGTYKENEETIYYIANEETVNSDLFKPLTNMGTLEDFRSLVNAGTFTYEEARLIEDIKLNEGKYEVTEEGITFAEDAEEWTPIGVQNHYFNKKLDGQGYEITGIYIDDTNSTTGKNLGLFSETGSSAIIQNLGIKESSIKGYYSIASFVAINSGSINNCYSLATVEVTNQKAGGLVYKNEKTGTISNCYFEGYAFIKTTAVYVTLGGIAGENLGNILNSHNKAIVDIAVGYTAGGISASNSGTIKFCYNEGEIKGTKNTMGGISGSNSGTIENCYNIASVGTGYKELGGIAGSTAATSIIKNCYNTGEIGKGSDSVGGITGANNGIIENCYNLGNTSSFANVGGITGTNSGTIKSCYNKGTATGTINPVGGIVGKNENANKTPTITNCYNVGQVVKITTAYVGAGEITGKNGTTGIITNCYFLNLSGYGISETNDGTATDVLEKTESQMKAQDGSFIELLNYGLITNVFIEKQEDFPILSWQVE